MGKIHRRYEVKRIALAVAAMALAATANAGGLVDHLYLGANGLWQDGVTVAIPSALEVGGAASSSISPHLSAVGETYVGLSETYVRWSAGARATVSDAANPNFNTFLGIAYRGGSVSGFGGNEWAPDAGFGWRIMPDKMPRLLVTGKAGWGLTSKQTLLTLGLRWEVPIK